MRERIATAILATLSVIGNLSAGNAAKPSQDVLPASTKFSWSVAHYKTFQDHFATTGLGRLLLDPVLKPFLDDLPGQLRDKAAGHPLGALWIDVGFPASDLKDVSAGEVTWALVHPEGRAPERLLLVDIAGHQQQVAELLVKLDDVMRQRSAKKGEHRAGNTSLVVFDVPASGDIPQRKLVYFQEADELVFAESVAMSEKILAGLSGRGSDNLAGRAGYQAVMAECKRRAGDQAADGTLFCVPVDLGEALRELSPKDDERAEQALAVARKHNFDAVSAVGAFLTVGQGPFDFHIQAAIHAPQPWKNGMRVCQLPNAPLSLPAWVGRDYNSLATLNIDFGQAAKYIGPLFDDIYGEGEEGLYEDMKNTLREDPDGPQIDVDRELFGRLTGQTLMLTRDVLPASPDSPQRLIALRVADEAALQTLVKKVFEADPNAKTKKIAGHDVFFSYVEEDFDAFGADSPEGTQAGKVSFITCVANGHLMLATDEEILAAALRKGKPLAGDADYRQVAEHLKALGRKTSMQYFGRLSDVFRVSYELFRQGKQPDSAKSFAGLLNNLAAGEPPPPKEMVLDGSKLPAFDQVEQYFGLAGLVGVTTDDGWFLEGFVLKK